MDLNKLKELDVNQLQDMFTGLDPENIGSWPLPIKVLIYVAIVVVVIVAGNYFLISDKQAMLTREKGKEKELVGQFESKAFQALNLDQYRAQLVEMEESFGALLRQLPKDAEVPGLLEDITHTGLGSGLEFETIDLGSEVVKEFYAELPIQIHVVGDYHAFGAFVSGVAALPRIVTLDDFEIVPREETGLLDMKITARTYRYNSREEE